MELSFAMKIQEQKKTYKKERRKEKTDNQIYMQ